MAGAKKSTWIGGTVVGVVLIMVAAWFLAVSPALASAADLHSQAETTRQQNDILQAQVNKLASEFKKLPEYQAQLAAIKAQMPSDPKLADFLRHLDAIAVAHGVTVLTVTPTPPVAVSLAVVPTAPAAAAAQPSAAPTAGPAPTAAPAAGGTATTTPAGFKSIGFSMEVQGTYDATVAFVYDLQNAMPDMFLVSGLSGQGLDKVDGSNGHPASAVGDQDLTITGLTYVLPDAAGAAPAPTASPSAAAPALPAPNGRDPLVPIVKK
jgi:hypothetical protein